MFPGVGFHSINMASVAMLLAALDIFLFTDITEGSHQVPISPKLVDISDHWERNGVIHQEKHVDEVIVKQGLGALNLVCSIDPPLPLTEEHFRQRNDLVKFQKLYPEHYVVSRRRYWSDDQRKTAVTLHTDSAGLFGTYACTYGNVSKTVEVLAEDTDVLKDFPTPRTLEEMFSFSFVKKRRATAASHGLKHVKPLMANKDFLCNQSKSKVKPDSVHRLSPSDVDVVATLGDSIMVGLGARAVSLYHFFTEHRGISWSNGGDSTIKDTVTLPNILKVFNPRLKGYSTNTGRYYEETSGLNMATVSSTTTDLQGQVKDLIDKLKQSKEINFKDDWKLITIMMGSRDLCRLCNNQVVITPDDYIKLVMKALDTLQTELPRAFVNLVLPLNVSTLDVFYRSGDCLLQNWSVCRCITEESMRKKILNFLLGYKRLVYELVDSGLYDRRDDFTVVVQPVFDNLTFAVQERDVFSLDCFHFSAKGHGLAAISLWNNMLEPVKRKHSHLSDGLIKCPSQESPYLVTNQNSKEKTKYEGTANSHGGRSQEMSAGVIAAVCVSVFCALFFVLAFVFLKRKLRAPMTKLHFSNRPWLKLSI